MLSARNRARADDLVGDPDVARSESQKLLQRIAIL
jgi:hypothetical protein